VRTRPHVPIVMECMRTGINIASRVAGDCVPVSVGAVMAAGANIARRVFGVTTWINIAIWMAGVAYFKGVKREGDDQRNDQ